jgi:hypothetical protein
MFIASDWWSSVPHKPEQESCVARKYVARAPPPASRHDQPPENNRYTKFEASHDDARLGRTPLSVQVLTFFW